MVLGKTLITIHLMVVMVVMVMVRSGQGKDIQVGLEELRNSMEWGPEPSGQDESASLLRSLNRVICRVGPYAYPLSHMCTPSTPTPRGGNAAVRWGPTLP